MFLAPEIKNWVFVPIMLVMILVGLLRNYGTKLLNSRPKPEAAQIRETSALFRARNTRLHQSLISSKAFHIRKRFLIDAFKEKEYLKNKNIEGAAPNPMSDPAAMEGTMAMMQKNMLMFIPQTLIMSWISYFFSGFVLTRLPFPLTVRFKEMLQRGIQTTDMDVTWVSSLSWYFLNLFGLTSVYTLILGQNSEANGAMDMMAMQQMGKSNPMQQPSEIAKMFTNEQEYLELAVHSFAYEDIEERTLVKFGKLSLRSKKFR